MGPTLTEGRTDEGSDPSRERDGQGVRQRLVGAVTLLAARLLSAVAGAFRPAEQGAREKQRSGGGTKGDQSREAVAIRPSGQARLESGPAGPRSARTTDHENEPQIAARVRGDRLRIYDTEEDDAYITSDIYERVER